jgi:heavy metal efflux system protein
MRGKMREEETVLIRWAKKFYLPLLSLSLRLRPIVIAAAVLLVVSSAFLASRMGAEFIPSLDEGDFALDINRIPGTSLTQALRMQETLEL